MSIDEIREFIAVAREDYRNAGELLDIGKPRLAISRIYYSVFYYMTALLLTKNMKFKSHKSVVVFFNKEFVKTDLFPQRDYKLVKEAFELRQEADYQLIHHGEKIVEDIINGVGEFSERAEKYLTDFIEKNQ